MLVYFDNCSLQRPLDDKSQLRVRLESEAVLAVLELCEAGEIRLGSSEVLLFEISRTPDPLRRIYAQEVLARASVHAETNEEVAKLARALQEQGIRPLDALHLASAVHSKADFFCTCDDKLLKRARSVETTATRVVSPLELIQEMDPWLSR